MSRLFVAVPLPEPIKDSFSIYLSRLRQLSKNLKAVSKEQLHLTLKFLGEVDEEKALFVKTKLEKIAAQYDPFQLKLDAAEVFPNSQDPKVVWLGTESPEIVQLMREMEHTFSDIRKNEYASEKPHLTLARIKARLDEAKSIAVMSLAAEIKTKLQQKDLDAFMVDRFVLYESKLTLAGPVYREVKSFSLNEEVSA
jgi:2'-5' RNA ligase